MLKYCAVFSLCAGVGLAADYMTGQAARAVIGQTTFTAQASGASNTLMGGVGGVAYANNTLFVTDSNREGNIPVNNRVLLFNDLSHMIPAPTAEIGPNTGRCPVCAVGASLVLGQPDFTSTNYQISANGMRLPTAVATDGRILAVADTANNRVLLWKSIPTQMDQPADLVIGQPDFITVQPVIVTQSSLRAPQGVWIQNGRLFVADTQNDRVMIWNSIPTKNNQPADLVLGAPNFTTTPNLNLIDSSLVAAANTMINPTSVTSDGKHVFVADLGFNRVLIWNEIPTTNGQNADVEVGQINFTTSFANDNTDLCASVGTDASGNPIYPATCVNTLSFPRFALSDGTRLYIADAGNDRVLVFNTIPTVNGAGADVVLGQPDQYADVLVTSQNDEFDPNLAQSASYATPAPSGLAWDGTNLYVTDSLNYRVLVFTPETATVPINGVVNQASQAIYAQGSITFSGTIEAGDCLLLNIGTAYQFNPTYYVYTVQTGDTLDTITTNVANIINGVGNVPGGTCAATPNPSYTGGDYNVFAVPELDFDLVKLVARGPGVLGDQIQITATTGATITTTATTTNNVVTTTEAVSGTATLVAATSASTLQNGGNASILSPGALISIQGTNLSDNTITTPADSLSPTPNDAPLPLELGGVEVYVDGIRIGILGVSPTQIDAQIPYEIIDTNSSSLYVRTVHNNGTVTVTTAVGLQITSTGAPGLYAAPGPEPRQLTATHYSSYATGIIDVAGSPTPGDTVTITVEDRQYDYAVTAADTVFTIRDGLVALINSNGDERVGATASGSDFSPGQFAGIVLTAKVPGSAGNGLVIAGAAVGETTTNATTGVVSTSSPTESITAINSQLCCANIGGAPVTSFNPAVPGEMIIVYATGLGLVGPGPALAATQDFLPYEGPTLNNPTSSVSSQIGGLTGNVIFAGLQVGAIGLYQVVLQLPGDLPTNPLTQVTIAQNIYTSNLTVIPVFSPSPTSGKAP